MIDQLIAGCLKKAIVRLCGLFPERWWPTLTRIGLYDQVFVSHETPHFPLLVNEVGLEWRDR